MPRCYLRLLLLFVLTLGLGCEDAEQVRQYRIPKTRSDLGDIGVKKIPEASAPAATQQPIESRMVVAIAEREESTWFFKITGPVTAVNNSQDQWQSILKSIKYGDNGNPDWNLPEGWKLGPPKQMRFATLLMSADKNEQVEMAISSLGPDQDMLNNVNRWRNQLGLKPLAKDELEFATFGSSAGEMKVFDATGKLMLTGAMARPAEREIAPPQPQRPELKYDIPEGWIESNQSAMVPVRLRFGKDKSAPQITVTQLLAAAGEWIPNAQRWAGQVSMANDEESLNALSSEITVDGIVGQKIRLIPDEEESKIGMIGAMVIRDDIAWFFKLIGDKKFVEENQEMFDQFMKTFKFD